MRAALWGALALHGAPLPLLSLAELSLLVADRSLKGLGALPMALVGLLALYSAPVAHLTFSLLAIVLLTSAVSHAFPSHFPLSSVQPLALAASALPLLRNPSLTPLVFVLPLLVQMLWQRLAKSTDQHDEASWLSAAVCSLVLCFSTRAHVMRGMVDAFVALGLLAALLSRSTSLRTSARSLTDWHVSPLLVLAPPMLGALLYLLLSSHNSSVAALVPGHGALRVISVTLTAFLLLVSTLYRRYLPASVAGPLLVVACALVGFHAGSFIGLLFGAFSAWLLTTASQRNAPIRVPASALCASLLMLLLSHRAAPHLSFSSQLILTVALFTSLLSAAWLTAPRLAPLSQGRVTAVTAAGLTAKALALLYALLERNLADSLPWWTCAITSAMLYALAHRMRLSGANSNATWLLLSVITAKSILVLPSLFPHIYAASLSLLSPNSPLAVLILSLLSATLLYPTSFRPTNRSHFMTALAAACTSALVCVLLFVPITSQRAALACVPLFGAPAMWAWHESPTMLMPLALPLVLAQVYARALLGPLDAILLAIALVSALITASSSSPSSTLSPQARTYAPCLAAAAGALWLMRPASVLVSLLASISAALWTPVLINGQNIAMLGEASLGVLLFSIASLPSLIRPLIYVRILAAAAGLHVALLLLPHAYPLTSVSSLSLPQPVLALFAFAYSFAAIRTLLPVAHFSSSLLFALISPTLLLAPPPASMPTRLALPLAFATSSLHLAVLLAAEPNVVSMIALIAALVGGVPLIQVTRVVVFNTQSIYAAPWLMPIPFAVLALILGSTEARVLAALGMAASVWLMQHGYRKHQHDLQRV